MVCSKGSSYHTFYYNVNPNMLSLSLCSLLLSRHMQALPDSFAQPTDDPSYAKQIAPTSTLDSRAMAFCNNYLLGHIVTNFNPEVDDAVIECRCALVG